MLKKLYSISTICLLLISCLSFISASSEIIQTSSGTTWYVDDDGPADFTSIQDAIDASSDGDTVYVYNGTYNENIVINKANLTLQGEDNENTVINATIEEDTIIINADYVSLQGFKLINSGSDHTIFVKNNNCKIKGNIIYGNSLICLLNTLNNIIDGNILYGSVSLLNSDNNIVTSNILYEAAAIYIQFASSNNEITKNIIDQEVPSVGIMLGDFTNPDVKNNIISYNTIKNCKHGIDVYFSENTISYNDFLNNKINANVYFRGHCLWYHNYWGASNRFPFEWKTHIPRLVYGKILSATPSGSTIFLDLDLFPARTPNCDFGGET